MGYMHIDNLYKNQAILMFKECYALEKVHGTSAHIKWSKAEVGHCLSFFSGGEKHEKFLSLFETDKLCLAFEALGHNEVVVYGEAYGGKQQGMRETYGDALCFIVFDVKVGETWLDVPNALDVTKKLGLEFVPWERVPTDINVLNAIRDRKSEVASLRGCGNEKEREGIVLRPLEELIDKRGNRIIAKHKGDKFSERASPTPIVDPAKLTVLRDAQRIADEWVTDMRLEHVLQKFPSDVDMKSTGAIIAAMVEDIEREASGEIVESKEARAAIGKKTGIMFRARLQKVLEK